MEQYFVASDINDEAEKVLTATMYLTGNAKQWWRGIFEDIQDGRSHVDTWPRLREALQDHFFPNNVTFDAHLALRDLKHTGSITEYVRTYAEIILDLRGMDEATKVQQFIVGLKPWARTELQRQQITTLLAAMAAAE